MSVPRTPALGSLDLHERGFDPEQEERANAPAGSENHVGDRGTTTLPIMKLGYQTTEEHAAQLAARWDKRVQEEGKRVYLCPHCAPGDRIDHATEKEAVKHIKTAHPAVLEEIKLTKGKIAHKEALKPRVKIRSPKRTLSDFVSPQHAALVSRQQAAQADLIPIQDLAIRASKRSITPGTLAALPESMAKVRVKELDDRDLIEALRVADARGKRDLCRAIKAHMTTRGIHQHMNIPDAPDETTPAVPAPAPTRGRPKTVKKPKAAKTAKRRVTKKKK